MQVSHVKGGQPINRGEIESVAWVSEFYARQIPRPLVVDIYTDSSFVVKVVASLQARLLDPRTYNPAHYDLISRLCIYIYMRLGIQDVFGQLKYHTVRFLMP